MGITCMLMSTRKRWVEIGRINLAIPTKPEDVINYSHFIAIYYQEMAGLISQHQILKCSNADIAI